MPEITELKYEQLTDEQKAAADKATILETETNLYLVEEGTGKLRGYRAAEMFDNGKPVKWSEALDLNGMPLPKKKRVAMTAAAEEKVRLASEARPELKTRLEALATKTEPAGATDLIKWVPLNLIDRCPFQPRKTFDRTRLDELKASIRAHGFVAEMSHFWVRPHPVHANRFELIDGERRQIVTGELVKEEMFGGLVPITVSNLTDAQVLEYALVNAMQREELSVIEEAEAICRRLEIPNADGTMPTVMDLAGHLGCTPAHITRCKLFRRLRDTPAGAALEAGHISKEHGALLARVASPAKRDELTRRVLKPGDGRGVMPAEVLADWIKKEVQIDLGGAEFDIFNAELVPLATDAGGQRKCGGACGEPNPAKGAERVKWTCPFVEVAVGSAKCLNPECYRLKQNASYDDWRSKTEAGAPNIVTISAEESDRLWDHTGKRLAPNSGYVELDAKPEEWDLKAGQVSGLTWKKLLRMAGSNDIPAIPVLVVKDRNGALHELVKRDQAKQIATDLGHDIFRGMSGQAEPAEPAGIAAADDGDRRISRAGEAVLAEAAREEKAAQQAERDAASKREGLLAERTTLALKRGVMEGARGLKRLSPEFWHLILGPMVDAVKEQGRMEDLCEVLGKTEHLTNPVDNEDWLDKIVRGTPVEHMPSLAVVVAREMVYMGEAEVWMKLACKTFGVDAKAVRRVVVAQLESEEEIARLEAEIENGVDWGPELREKADEFEWLNDGDCANANVARLALPKGVKHTAFVAVGRISKGWVAGYELQFGKKVLAQDLPNRNQATYSNAALATKTALLALKQAMEATGTVPAIAVDRVAAYIARVKLPAEKPAKAKPAKKAKAAKKGGVD